MKFFVLIMLLAGSSWAAVFEKVTLPDTIKIEKTPLVLNGMGLRTATVFKVRVYVAGLYLPKKASDSETIFKMEGPKQIVLQFVRSVSGEDMGKAWDESLERNCKEKCEGKKKAIDKLKTFIPDLPEGSKLAYTVFDNKVQVLLNDKVKGEVVSKELPSLILNTWLGPNPPNEDLKIGLLGKLEPKKSDG